MSTKPTAPEAANKNALARLAAFATWADLPKPSVFIPTPSQTPSSPINSSNQERRKNRE
jgi:hypothetical protein